MYVKRQNSLRLHANQKYKQTTDTDCSFKQSRVLLQSLVALSTVKFTIPVQPTAPSAGLLRPISTQKTESGWRDHGVGIAGHFLKAVQHAETHRRQAVEMAIAINLKESH